MHYPPAHNANTCCHGITQAVATESWRQIIAEHAHQQRPLLVGMLSDYLAPTFGSDSLRYAMAAGISVMGWGVVHFWFSSKHYRDELIS